MCSIGITLTFFWKKQKEDSNYAVASGAKVISNDFSVFTTSDKGFVELYSRDDKHRWRAEVPLSGTANAELPHNVIHTHPAGIHLI